LLSIVTRQFSLAIWRILYIKLTTDHFRAYLRDGICAPWEFVVRRTFPKFLTLKPKVKHNISREERNAIKSLRLDKNIIIQKADKGGGIVVLNTTDYKNKILSMLNDPVTYTEIPRIDLQAAKLSTDSAILSLYAGDFISKKQKKYLMRCEPKLPVLYGLPKIHKLNWPLRPIVSQINSPAYNLNKLLDYYLTTAEKSIPNLLQDTTKFLQIINSLNTLPPNCILFTIDVTSLYTVLPHDMVLNYVEETYLESLSDWYKYTPDMQPIPSGFIKLMIKIILDQTFFTFDGKIYKQNYGITMGAPSSVKLANITLHKHLLNISKNHPKTMPFLQLRLIDDIFGVWTGTESELLDWVAFLNNSHTSIKFTLEFSKTEIPFLDTLVYIENNKLKTKLYKKPTDNKQYLHFNSEHPQHVKKAIPYAQALRYRRIIEDDHILLVELQKLKENFIIRQYPEKIVDSAISRVLQLDRSEIIKYRPKTAKSWQFIPFVLTYNNALVSNNVANIYKLLTISWQELVTASPDLNELSLPKIVFRKCTTINSLLVSAVFPPPRWPGTVIYQCLTITPPSDCAVQSDPSEPSELIETLKRSSPCKKPKCLTCSLIENNYRFHSTKYNNNFNLLDDVNCSSTCVIYLITCLKCHIQYVGETSNPLRERMNGHRSCINLNRDTPIGIHFNSKGHNLSHLNVMPIEQLYTLDINHRRSREFYWQLTLGTIFPSGLNAFPVDLRDRFTRLEMYNIKDLELFWTLVCLQNVPEDSD